jgi:hypothetical protein
MRFNHNLFWFFQYLYAQCTLFPKLLLILVIFYHIPLLKTVLVSLLCILFSISWFSCPILFMYPYNFTLLLSTEQCFPLYPCILYYIWTVINLISCLQKLTYTDFNWAFILRQFIRVQLNIFYASCCTNILRFWFSYSMFCQK